MRCTCSSSSSDGNFARIDGGLVLVAEEEAARLLVIEAGGGRFFSAVCTAPVGEDESGELPVFLQHVGEQVFVLAGEVAVDAVIGAHDGGGMSLGNADFKCQQIAFARGAFADGDVDGVASALLVVERVVLDVADHVGGLRALDEPGHQRAGEDRIFAEVFKGAAVARLAGEVHAAAERHVESLRAEFATDERAVFVGRFGVPACGCRDVGRERGGIAAVHAAGAHAVGRVAHVDTGNAEARNADGIADAAVRRLRFQA